MSPLRLLLALAGAAVAAATASSKPVDTRIQWVDCAHNVPLPLQQQFNVTTWTGALPATLACGRLNVPLDYARPLGANNAISIGFAMNRPKRPKGLLSFNPGGPGLEVASYAWLLALNATDVPAYFAGLLDYDFLAIDVRGSYQSAPLNCSAAAVAALPFTLPTSAAQFAALQARVAALARSCVAGTAPRGLVAHVGTAEVVQDWDRVRAALGYETMHFIGVSYGTYSGAEYATRFAKHAGNVVLDAVTPHGIPASGAVDQYRAVNRLLLRADAYCIYDPSCPFHAQGKGAVPAAFKSVVALAANGTFPGVSAAEAKVMLYYYLSGAPDFPLFHLVLAAALAGDGSALQPSADVQAAIASALPVFCLDEAVTDLSWADFKQVMNDAAKVDTAHFDYVLSLYLKMACSAWPIPGRPSQTLTIKKPVLLVTADYDLNTPTEWATFQWQYSPRSSLVVRHGDDHGTLYLPGQPARDLEVAFIRTGVQPRAREQRLVSVYAPGTQRPPVPDPYKAPIGPEAGDETSVE